MTLNSFVLLKMYYIYILSILKNVVYIYIVSIVLTLAVLL